MDRSPTPFRRRSVTRWLIRTEPAALLSLLVLAVAVLAITVFGGRSSAPPTTGPTTTPAGP